MGVEACTYRHECLPAVVEVESGEQCPRVPGLVALDPRLAQQLPFRVEVSAHLASVSAVHGCQEDGNRVVTGQPGDLLICGIVKLDR